jgi:hypothetical protein
MENIEDLEAMLDSAEAQLNTPMTIDEMNKLAQGIFDLEDEIASKRKKLIEDTEW